MLTLGLLWRSRFGALWDGILRFVGFGYGGSGTIRLGWVWLRAVRFDMAVKTGQLSAGRGEFRLVKAVKLGSGWAAFGQAGRGLVRYGGFRSVKLRQPRWGIMQISHHILTLVGEEDGRQN